MKVNRATAYNLLLTGFFWLVQLNDITRIRWFFDSLMSDSVVSAWLMTIAVEAGMGLLSLDLLSRITANSQRPRREGRPTGYKQPITLLVTSVLVLGILEAFISIAFFYEFGRVTKLTERLLGGDTLGTAIVFGTLSTVLTFVFAAVEGERAQIEQHKQDKKRDLAERKRARLAAKQAEAKAKREEAKAKQEKARAEQEEADLLRQRIKAEPYACNLCGKRFATTQALAGHMRWCKHTTRNKHGE